MSNRSRRSGRKDATERIRELVALLGSLSKTGDTVTLDAISKRLGITLREAEDLMDIVCQASGEESSGLTISANDDMTEFTLQYPNVHGQPIRLTPAETVALVHALDEVGIPDDDSLRKNLGIEFSSSEVKTDMVRRALGTRNDPGSKQVRDVLFVCAQAQAENREIAFDYLGLRDNEPRHRCAAIKTIYSSHDAWYIRATDLDLEQERVFRADRTSNAKLGRCLGSACPNVIQANTTRVVRITFTDESCLTLMDWHDLKVLSRKTGCITCEIPYYGSYSRWLVRRIASCGSKVYVYDDALRSEVRKYAHSLLE